MGGGRAEKPRETRESTVGRRGRAEKPRETTQMGGGSAESPARHAKARWSGGSAEKPRETTQMGGGSAEKRRETRESTAGRREKAPCEAREWAV